MNSTSGAEIAFLVISVLLVAAIFFTKAKKHAGDSRIRSRRERERERNKPHE